MPGPAHGALSPTEALARLGRNERGLRRLVESAADAMLLIDHDGFIVLGNPVAQALLGHPPADLVAMPVEDLVAPAARAGHRARREAFAADPPPGHTGLVYRVPALTREGREVPVEVSLSAIETAGGPLTCATIRDVSAELLHQRQDAALRRIAAAGGADIPLGSLLAMVAEEAAALLGADRALIARFDQGAVVVAGAHGDRRAAVGDVVPADGGSCLVAVARTGDVAGTPADRRREVAVPIAVHARLWGGLMVAATDPVPAAEVGALARFAEFAGAMIAAAESRLTERALRESEERFRLLADFIPQLLWTTTAEGACDFVNRRWVEYTGIPAEEQLGLGWLERVHPDDRDALTRSWNAAVSGGGAFVSEFRIRRHDGAYRRFDTRGVAMLDETGAVAKWFGSNTDVEEARAAAQAVSASEAQLRAALDAGRMGAWTLEVGSDLLTVDGNVRGLFAIGPEVPESAIRETLRDRIHVDDRALLSESFAKALSGETQEYHSEYRALLPDGRRRWIESRGRVARDADGTPLAVTGVILDVTDARQAGERLLRSQKLEALGTLAGGIAHDFNNLLQVVGGNVAMARAELPEGHGAQEHLGTVERATQRAADLVDRILAFSRPDEGAPRERLDLGALVEDALDLLRPTLPAMIELCSSSDAALPAVSADPAAVAQVVTNLATNAAQAIGRRSGVVEFRAEAVTITADEAASAPELAHGAYARLTVSDDGPGMDAEVLARIFDPFFTTKGPGVGTGLGLSIVHSLMRAHGGAVTAYSVPGTGTSFRLYFPVEAPAPAAAPPAAPAPPAAGRRGRILFVDDEPDLVALHERSLGRVGHVVAGYTDPRAALEEFRADPEAFDAVVTDLSMPAVTGLELAREVLALRPGIPVLITSGYVPPEERAEAEALGVREILPKPSPIARLREALAAALASEPR